MGGSDTSRAAPPARLHCRTIAPGAAL